MRFLSGLILGVVLTIGTAFVVDAVHTPSGTDSAQRMVNWTVVSDNIRGLSADVQDGWNRLVGQTRDLEKRAGA